MKPLFFLKNQLKHRVVFLLCILVEMSIFISSVQANSPPRRVLFINSYHRGFQWSDGIEEGIRETLKSFHQPTDLFVEYLDTHRFSDLNYLFSVAEMFTSKYNKMPLDAIIVSDNPAFDFAVKYREKVFPNTPIVFCGYNSFRPEIIQGMKNITGVNEEVDFTGTINMALSISPKIQKMVFVTSDYYSTGKMIQDTVEKTLIPAYQHRFQILQLKNLHLSEIRTKLSTLTPDTLVFLFGLPVDYLLNKSMKVEEYYRQQALASSVPTYSFWDFILNTGILGGDVLTGQDQGKLAAELALKILNGTPADQLPVIMTTPTKKIFDFNAMQRFGISENILPEHRIVINKPDSFYQRYKTYLWVIIGTIASLVIILALLFFYSRRLGIHLQLETKERKRAEEALRLHYEELEQTILERTAEIQRANQALQEQEALFHGMFDSHSAVMFLLNPESGNFIEANQSAANYYGYTPEELKALTIYDINQATREELNQEMEQAQLEKRDYFLFRHRLANGEIRDVEVYATPIVWQRQHLLFSIEHDVTERKRIHDALKTREQELNELNVTKNRLFSIIAHDLRNPFNAILSFSEYLLENLSASTLQESKELIKDIHLTANNTFKLLNNLLDWARTQTNQVKISLEKIDVSLNIKEIITDLTPIALNKNIMLSYLNPTEVFSYTDQNMLNTILRNLISNSIKYTEIGGKIEVSTQPKDQYIEFSVVDNGIGMTEGIKNQLFISNVNQSTYGTYKEKGTGLGLVICRDFVKKLGGHIWVESELHKGSAFKFTLPIASHPVKPVIM
jgi:PAS domain S-box-containing protein